MCYVYIHSNPVITNPDKPNSSVRQILKEGKVPLNYTTVLPS